MNEPGGIRIVRRFPSDSQPRSTVEPVRENRFCDRVRLITPESLVAGRQDFFSEEQIDVLLGNALRIVGPKPPGTKIGESVYLVELTSKRTEGDSYLQIGWMHGSVFALDIMFDSKRRRTGGRRDEMDYVGLHLGKVLDTYLQKPSFTFFDSEAPQNPRVEESEAGELRSLILALHSRPRQIAVVRRMPEY